MIEKIIETSEGTFHYCTNCEDYLPIGEFYRCAKCVSGYQYRCKPCYRRRWRELNPVYPTDEETLKILLSRMGFDTNSEKTIHEQFVERVLEKNGVDLTQKIPRRRGKHYHLNPPHYASKEYSNWYNQVVRKKKD